MGADTDDLWHFVDRGRGHVRALTATSDQLSAARRRVVAAMSAAAGALPIVTAEDRFVALVEVATANNGFVERIIMALTGSDGLRSVEDRSVIEALDPHTRASLTVARYFAQIFGHDVIEGDLAAQFAAIARPYRLADIEQRLTADGYQGERLDAALEDIALAGRFYSHSANGRELRALDDANDHDRDGDQRLRATDAWLRTIALTGAAEGPTDRTSASTIIRHHAITAWVVDRSLAARDLQEVYDGASLLGPLSPLDRQVLVDGFIGAKVAASFDTGAMDRDGRIDVYRAADLAELRMLSNQGFSPDLTDALAGSLTEQAIRLELTGANLDPVEAGNGAFVASLLAGEALELVAGEEAAFINAMDGERAALFAASLGLDTTFDRYLGVDTLSYRSELAAGALRSLSDHSGDGGAFEPGGEGFVLMTQSTAATGAYATLGRPSVLGRELARATAIAAHPGRAEAQAEHRRRLTELFEHPAAVAALASDPVDIDAATRSQVLHLAIHGVRTADGGHRFWTAADFADRGAAVAADLVVEQARIYHRAAHGRQLPVAVEARLRALAATGQFQDLIGLNDRSTVSLRAQFTAMAIERGWNADDFRGRDSGWEHPEVNGEYLAWLAERTDPDLSLAALDNLRAIAASQMGQAHLGLGLDITDEERLAYVAHIVANGWTVETFEAADPIHNDVINDAFARRAFASFGPETEISRALAALDPAAAGYSEAYVRTALGLDRNGGGDDLVDRIVEEIGGVDPEVGLALIPIHLRTPDRHVELLLFETIRDGRPVVVDLNGKSYRDPDDWYRHNELPPARVTYPGIRGTTPTASVFVSPAEGDRYELVHRVTENYPDTFSEKYLDWVITGAVIVGGVLMVVGSGGLATPVVGAGAAAALGTTGSVLVGSVAAYELASGANQLYDHVSHGGDWDDGQAVGAYFTLGEGFLTAISVGSYTAARRGIPMSGNVAGALIYANRATEALEVGLNAGQAWQVIDSDLPAAEKRRQLAILGVLGAAEYGIPFAANQAIRNRPELDGIDDAELAVAISNGTVSVEALRTNLGTGQGTTTSVHTVGDLPTGPARRAFLLNPNNWTAERRALHDRLIDEAVAQAVIFDAAVGGEPAIYAMRGNTAAGKTRAIRGNIPELEPAIEATADLPHRAINPDNFKVDLRAADADLPLNSNQVHEESSILAERLRNELAARQRPDGQPISFLVDQRLGRSRDVTALRRLAEQSGRRLHVYDVDAPLEVSLVGVLMRPPGGADPIPPFHVIADEGFLLVRNQRDRVAQLFQQHPELGTYRLLTTDRAGRKIHAADVRHGELSVFDVARWNDAVSPTESDIERLRTTPIDREFIERFTARLEPSYAIEVRVALEPYIGITWADAVDDHSQKRPSLD
ncbi:MAG: zeta toxin family protein [Actinomycetota bacterium]